MRLVLLVMLTLASAGAHASARDRFDTFSADIKGLSANFAQRVFDSRGVQKEESSGELKMRAPRQFRWEYFKPFPQQIIADGDNIWVYDPDLEQVTVRRQSLEEQNSPLAVLIDPGEMERQFIVKEGGKAQGLEWLDLTPRKPDEAQIDRARLGFGARGLARMELFDSLGQRTEIDFSAWKRNPAFATGTFTFKPPNGVDIVGEIAPSAEIIPLQD